MSRTKEHATFGEHRARRARRVTLVERAKKRLENRVGTARRVPPDKRRRESGTRESVGGGGWFQDGEEEGSAADSEEDRGRARRGKGESVDEGGDDVRDGRRVSSRVKKTRAMDGAEGRLENGDDRGAGREADALARAGGSEGGVGDARRLGDGLEEGEARDVDEGADAVGEDEGVRAGGERVGGGSAMWTSTPSGMLMSASSGGQGARASVASREGATAGRDPEESSLLALVASGATRRGG